MKESKSRAGQMSLFQAPPAELPTQQRAEAVALLGVLLSEAVAMHTQQAREVSHDQDHG